MAVFHQDVSCCWLLPSPSRLLLLLLRFLLTFPLNVFFFKYKINLKAQQQTTWWAAWWLIFIVFPTRSSQTTDYLRGFLFAGWTDSDGTGKLSRWWAAYKNLPIHLSAFSSESTAGAQLLQEQHSACVPVNTFIHQWKQTMCVYKGTVHPEIYSSTPPPDDIESSQPKVQFQFSQWWWSSSYATNSHFSLVTKPASPSQISRRLTS